MCLQLQSLTFAFVFHIYNVTVVGHWHLHYVTCKQFFSRQDSVPCFTFFQADGDVLKDTSCWMWKGWHELAANSEHFKFENPAFCIEKYARPFWTFVSSMTLRIAFLTKLCPSRSLANFFDMSQIWHPEQTCFASTILFVWTSLVSNGIRKLRTPKSTIQRWRQGFDIIEMIWSISQPLL